VKCFFGYQQLLLVTKEAFHNILKHAQATEVWWQMEVQGEQLFFSLEDNGIGLKKEAAIQPSSNGKKNGLNNMAARMESIGGWFAISNRSEGGTRVKYGFG
jgi:signal transduction histidine kinase